MTGRANSRNLDQTPRYSASDMGLHCLHMSFYGTLDRGGVEIVREGAIVECSERIGAHSLCTRPNEVYILINLRKMKFIPKKVTTSYYSYARPAQPGPILLKRS